MWVTVGSLLPRSLSGSADTGSLASPSLICRRLLSGLGQISPLSLVFSFVKEKVSRSLIGLELKGSWSLGMSVLKR